VNRQTLLASTAIALLMCSLPASAQMQDKNSERTPGAATGGPQKQEGSRAQQKNEQSTKGAEKNTRAEPSGSSHGNTTASERSGTDASRTREGSKGQGRTAEGQSRDQSGDTQSRGKGTQTQQHQQKGAQSPSRQKGAETQSGQKSGQRQKGAEMPTDGGTQQSQQRTQQPEGKGSAKSETNGAVGKSAEQGGTRRLQVSEEQRNNLHQTLLKERNLNRVDRLDVSVNVGTRVPRSVRLVPLPVSVVALVPQYRSYRYFVSNDEIYIVNPRSFEVVEVIRADTRGAHAALSLTPEEQDIVLRNVEIDGGSTLGLGSLSEGAPVPRGVRVEPFPDRVVKEVPKLRDYTYFTAENRVAIVDPDGRRVALVLHH
jgi:hypothetical protein